MYSDNDMTFYTYCDRYRGYSLIFFGVFSSIFVCIGYLSFERKLFFLNKLNLFGLGMLS